MALGLCSSQGSSVVNFGRGSWCCSGAMSRGPRSYKCTYPSTRLAPDARDVNGFVGLIIERGSLATSDRAALISVIMVTFGFASVIRGVSNMGLGQRYPSIPGAVLLGPLPPWARFPCRQSTCGVS